MFEINEFLDTYRKDTHSDLGSTGYFAAPPFFFYGHDESIAIRFSEDEEGNIYFSDCHVTLDFLEVEDIDITLYQDKLQKILARYDMVLDGNVFRMKVYNSAPNTIERYLGYFIQALCLIANIDL